jgi:tetratricopeptide (TPR) repeat protein
MKNLLSAALIAFLGMGLSWGAQAEKPNSAAKPEQGQQQAAGAPDRAKAYYHFSLGHLYEEMAMTYKRQDYVQKAIDNYKLALQYDPGSSFVAEALADLYAGTNRLREAVQEAEDILKRDPNNLEARKMLGRVYLRNLGNQPGGRIQTDVLRRAIEQYEKVVEADTKDVDSRVTLGRLYRINNDFSRCEAVLKQALALEPESEEALTSLAFLYADTSQFQAAIDLLEKVTAKNPNPRLLAALGSAYEQAHMPDKAVPAYRKALEQDKDNPEYLHALGQNLILAERYDEAIQTYKDLAAADPQDGNAFLRLGQVYRQLERYDEAAENLRKAATLMPDSLEVPFNQALLAETRGQTDEAIGILRGLLDKTAKTNPSSYSPRDKSNRAIFLERLGTLYRNSENYKAAEDSFRQMMDADQEDAVRGASQLIETIRQQRQLPRAIAEAEAASKRFPDERSLKLTYLSLVAENGQVEEAEKALRAMLQSKPDDREVLLTIAQMNERARRFPQAEQAVAEAEKFAANKDEKEFVYYMWGSILERQKKYEEAEVQFKKALAANPNSAVTLNYLGYMLADRGVRLEEARRYIQAALVQDPQNGAYLDSLGWVCFKMKRLDEAEQYLLKATQRISSDPTILDHLGDVYYESGKLREALAQWQKALVQAQKPNAAESEDVDTAAIQKKVETVRVRLAQQTKQ